MYDHSPSASSSSSLARISAISSCVKILLIHQHLLSVSMAASFSWIMIVLSLPVRIAQSWLKPCALFCTEIGDSLKRIASNTWKHRNHMGQLWNSAAKTICNKIFALVRHFTLKKYVHRLRKGFHLSLACMQWARRTQTHCPPQETDVQPFDCTSWDSSPASTCNPGKLHSLDLKRATISW